MSHENYQYCCTVIGLMDYPNVVKYPMDLGTVKDKIKNSEYVHVEECLDDIQLVWDNCKNYNAEGSVRNIWEKAALISLLFLI